VRTTRICKKLGGSCDVKENNTLKISRSKDIAIQRNNGHNVSTLSANLVVSLMRNSIAVVYHDTKKTMLNVSGFNH
jgi:hypothetical protein